LILRALPLEQAFAQSSPQFTYRSNASMTNRFSDGAKKVVDLRSPERLSDKALPKSRRSPMIENSPPILSVGSARARMAVRETDG